MQSPPIDGVQEVAEDRLRKSAALTESVQEEIKDSDDALLGGAHGASNSLPKGVENAQPEEEEEKAA